jgi:glutamate formiminotransferase / formiminotetrahydrofolate cyclodeaminase
MQSIVECIPNFSEGRDAAKVDAIVEAILAGPNVFLLDREMDADHNRSVVTFVGTRESVGEAALRGIRRAAELIDLTRHQGAHPRIGATDVVPFVPVSGVRLEECVRIAEQVGAETWRRFRIPTYLYEAAARSPERRNLENIRRGQFEGLRHEIASNPARRPDFGDPRLHPTAGATVVGARKYLIAYNIDLSTSDLPLAKSIARKIRASSGGLPAVKAMGVPLKSRNLVQVSMNLTDFETTSIATVFEAVGRESSAAGKHIAGSEIIGLVPQKALNDAAEHFLKIENFRLDSIFENRLAQVIEQQRRAAGRDGLQLSELAAAFVSAVAGPAATPGGGSVSALAGALAAALGEMVCGITLKRKSYAQQHAALQGRLEELAEIRRRLMENIDRDAKAFTSVMAAMKMPAVTAEQKIKREEAIHRASQVAAEVPLETAGLAKRAARILEALQPITLPQAASDLAVALRLARASQDGAAENVRANLPSVSEEAAKRLERTLAHLEKE